MYSQARNRGVGSPEDSRGKIGHSATLKSNREKVFCDSEGIDAVNNYNSVEYGSIGRAKD